MMPAGQQIPQDAASSANGHSTVHDLFVLTDEQILEIEPEIQDARASGSQETTPVAPAPLAAGSNETARNENHRLEASATASTAGASVAEPPPWLARQIKDPCRRRRRIARRLRIPKMPVR